VEIPAQAGDGAPLLGPFRFVAQEQAEAVFAHGVGSHGADALARRRMVQAHLLDQIAAPFQAAGEFGIARARAQMPGALKRTAEDPAIVELLELVAVDRVVE